MTFLSRIVRRFGVPLACLGALFMLSGCNELNDDTYTAIFTNRGAFQVWYSKSVDVELTQGEIIHLYSVGDGKGQADIKVSGKFHFAVHGCNTLKADGGATVSVYDCKSVKAMPGTTVITYNTPLVHAAKDVNVEVHGRTTVKRYDVKDNNTPTEISSEEKSN